MTVVARNLQVLAVIDSLLRLHGLTEEVLEGANAVAAPTRERAVRSFIVSILLFLKYVGTKWLQLQYSGCVKFD